MSESQITLAFDIIGTFGVGLILLAYFGVQTHRLKVENLPYSVLNLIGSILLLLSLLRSWNTPSVVIQTCWIAISLYAIAIILKKRRGETRHADQ